MGRGRPAPPPTGLSGTMQRRAMAPGKLVPSAFLAAARWLSTAGWALAASEVAVNSSAARSFFILAVGGVESVQALIAGTELLLGQAIERRGHGVEIGVHVLRGGIHIDQPGDQLAGGGAAL